MGVPCETGCERETSRDRTRTADLSGRRASRTQFQRPERAGDGRSVAAVRRAHARRRNTGRRPIRAGADARARRPARARAHVQVDCPRDRAARCLVISSHQTIENEGWARPV
eukprot:350445-Chlamydomonas_euryale.AAC.1